MPASEALEPIFSSVWFDVTKTVWERRGSAFYLSEDTFDSIPISMSFGLKLQPCSVKRSLEVIRAINEKHGVFDIVYLAKFSQKYFR